MKILLVTNGVPFPPRNGVELPIAYLARYLSDEHHVTILVYGHSDSDRREFEMRKSNVPASVRSVLYVEVQKSSLQPRLLAEIFLIRPRFQVEGHVDPSALLGIDAPSYDVVWVSPIGGLGLLRVLEKCGHKVGGKVALGLNDATYGIYANGIRSLFKRSIRHEWRRILNALRTPWIFVFERRFLRRVDYVHVQTELELRRVSRLLIWSRRKPKVFVARNGQQRTALAACEMIGASEKAPIVLLMTHLDGGRSRECLWFLRKIWPHISRARPDAELWIVGSPPPKSDQLFHSLPPQVFIKGYVDDLGLCLQRAAVGVIPTLHNSGWVNRIGDYLGAGVPLVACSEPLQTAEGIEPGRHALRADSVAAFANAVVTLLNCPDVADTLARNGLAIAQTYPTWRDTVATISENLLERGCSEL